MRKKPSQSATDWLTIFLRIKHPPKTTKLVEEIAEFMGYSKEELKKAKLECRVKVVDGIWTLPED